MKKGDRMRTIDADALMQTLGITDMDCAKCKWYSRAYRQCKKGGDFEDACTAIEDAPTVEPQRMRGRWIPTEPDEPCFYQCSLCRRLNDATDKFCPNCGADMRGGQADAV